jgi:hypothetical protein
MAERSRFDQLEALLAQPGGAADPELAALSAIAAELRDLPRPEFKQHLRNELTQG